eukprot:g2796.t1
MAEEEMEEATPEEKLRIAQHYLLCSPPGQINDVLTDVRKLLPDGLLTDDLLRAYFRTYNLDQYKVIVNGDHKMLVSAVGEVDASHYIDPASGEVVGVDHIGQAVVAEDRRPLGGEMDGALEDKRHALQRHVQDYLDRQYERNPKDGSCTGVRAVYAKGGVVTVLISAERLNLRNYWSGSWRNTITVAFPDSTHARVTGKLNLYIHYFEEGNVMMHSEKEYAEDVQFTDADQFAGAVTGAISRFEDTIQGGLEDMYQNMTKETFKDMRRVMPITKTKMNWNVNAHAMVQTLTSQGK